MDSNSVVAGKQCLFWQLKMLGMREELLAHLDVDIVWTLPLWHTNVPAGVDVSPLGNSKHKLIGVFKVLFTFHIVLLRVNNI